MTDVQPILKFQYAMFELMRRTFLHPEQTSNGVSDQPLMKELYWKEHADLMALDGQNIDQMKHSEAYDSMMLKHTTRQDQPTRKRLCTHETCSTVMRLNQINAGHQAKHEHLVNNKKDSTKSRHQILIIS